MSEQDIDKSLFGNDAPLIDTDTKTLQDQLQSFRQHLAELPADVSEADRARIKLDIAETLLALDDKEQAWNTAREVLDVFLQQQMWQQAVESYNVLFQSDQPASLSALGQGVWLAVTFPIAADTTVAMLQHIVEETPDDSDGGAVAAMAAHYIADIRSDDDDHDSLTFLTQNIIGQVAKRHSNVNTQAEMDMWIARLQLNDPNEFLPRLGKVIDVLVGDDWWYDRDKLRESLPIH